jgi:hypothetical protein
VLLEMVSLPVAPVSVSVLFKTVFRQLYCYQYPQQ